MTTCCAQHLSLSKNSEINIRTVKKANIMVSQKLINKTNNVLAPRWILRIIPCRRKSVQEEEEIDLGSSVKPKDIIVCARRDKVYAVHKKDGRRLWRIKSPIGSSGGIISIFVTEDFKVLLGANGKAACIELMTGKQVWTQKMKVWALWVLLLFTDHVLTNSDVGSATKSPY